MKRFVLVVVLALVAMVALSSPDTNPQPVPRKPFLRRMVEGVAAFILLRNVFFDSAAAEETQQLRDSLYGTNEFNVCHEMNIDEQRNTAADGIPLVNHETGW